MALAAGLPGSLGCQALDGPFGVLRSLLEKHVRAEFWLDLQVTLQGVHDRGRILAPARLTEVDFAHPTHAVFIHETLYSRLGHCRECAFPKTVCQDDGGGTLEKLS